MNNSELADKCQGVAACLTYNDDTPQGEAKHLLLECAHRLNSSHVKARQRWSGCIVIWNALGKQRYMTFRERLAYYLTGAVPTP
jgi:hypothetical protein